MEPHTGSRRLILFDIDGTLLLTGGAGKSAFNQAFQKLFGLSEAWRDIHPDGRTDPSLIDELFEKNFQRKPSDPERCQVEEAYTQAMPEALRQSERFRLMPGVVSLLTRIKERGWGLMGLATGNFEATAWHKLRHGGLADFFSFGGFGSDHADRFLLTRRATERGRTAIQRNIGSEEIFLIGDTLQDIDCGKRLGAVTVAVATGSTPQEVLAKARPDFLFPNLSDLEEVGTIFE